MLTLVSHNQDSIGLQSPQRHSKATSLKLADLSLPSSSRSHQPLITLIMRSRYPPPLILPAAKPDIPSLVSIWLSAKRPDLLYQQSWPPSTWSSGNLDKNLTSFLEQSFEGPEWLIMKAVDAHTGQNTALAMWEKRGYDSASPSLSRPRLAAGLLLKDAPVGKLDGSPDPINDYIGSQVLQFNEVWKKGIKYLELGLLMTDPAFQRRGIGTALLEWGLALADREKVPCFLLASPFGYPLYRSLGWNVVGEDIVLDLKEWVQYAEGGDMGWGVYKMRFMLRMPRIKE
jgi:GNAT superfamily N-acetyltransferase